MLEISEIHNIIEEHLKGQDALAVGVSGGADSLALCLILNDYCEKNKITLHVLSVDHGLRAEAADELKQLAVLLAPLKLEHRILQWQGEKPQKNIQQEARFARYRLMGKYCADHGISSLFLAHHMDDLAENFMIRLCRGSGVDGLSAMGLCSAFPVVLEDVEPRFLPYIIRPLLGAVKEDLKNYLKVKNQNWIEDPSNKNENYRRVQMRNFLGRQELEGLETFRLAETAQRMASVRDLLEGLTDELEKAAVRYYPEGYAVLNFVDYQKAHPEIARRLLARILKNTSGNIFAPRQIKMNYLDQTLRSGDLKGQTVGECFICKKLGKIFFFKEAAAVERASINLQSNTIFWDGRFWIKAADHSGIIRVITPQDWHDIGATRRDEFKSELSDLKTWSKVKFNFPILIQNTGQIILPKFKRNMGLKQNWLLF
jgi:tRNA(Ile)-lysidine synthase